MMTEHKMMVGLVIHNEATRLKAWLEHWLPMASDIVVLDQQSTDGSRAVLNEFACPKLTVLTVQRKGFPEFDFNTLQKMAGPEWCWHLGADEFIDPAQMDAIMRETERVSKEFVSTLWIRRKNFIDGVDTSAIMRNPADPQGYDWQSRLTRGWSCKYANNMHQYPHVEGRFVYLDPDKFWMEHRRTFDDVLRANIMRNDYATPEIINRQNQYCMAVAQMLGLTEDQYKEARARHE